MDKRESSEYSWDLVTADRRLYQGPCELVYAYLVPSGATTDSALYDGASTAGRKICTLKAAAVTNHEFRPPRPVYCAQGLYVDIGTNVSEVFVQWRAL